MPPREGVQGGGLAGFYRGKVVQHLSHGRCKVFVQGVYADEWENAPGMLPPAEQITPLFAGSNDGNGVFSYPNIGTIVIVGFWNQDQNMPFFFGATLGGLNACAQYKNCNQLSQEDDGAYVHKVVCGKSSITMSELGNVVIENRSFDVNTNEPADTVIIMDQSGNVKIQSSKTVKVQTGKIELMAADSIQAYTGEFKLKATKRAQIVSPYIQLNSKTDIGLNGKETAVSEKGQNGISLMSDTVNILAPDGYVNVESRTNGAQVL